MAMLRVLIVALSFACSVGHAQTEADLSYLTFWPQSRSSPAPAHDPQSAGNIGSAKARAWASGARVGELDPLAIQSAERTKLAAAVDKQVDALKKEEAANGERSSALVGQLTSLAEAYQAIGDYDAAAATLDEAIRLSRVNFGLYSLDQADAVESLAALKQAQGKYDEAFEHREYLRGLVRRNDNDPHVVGVLSGLASSEMDAARQSLGVPAPPQLIIRLGLPEPAPPRPRTPSLDALYAARSDYGAALAAAVRLGAGDVEDRFALEERLIDTVYFEFAHPEVYGPQSLYTRMNGGVLIPQRLSETGLEVLQARVRHSERLGRQPIDVARAMLELGDWYLVYAQFSWALDEYQRAHDWVAAHGVPDRTIHELLSPEIPPIVPVLPAEAAGSSLNRAVRGYIDAAVELTRFGQVRHVEILDESPGASRAIEKRLRHYLAASCFRPRFLEGQPARSDRFEARFYFRY